MAQDPSHTPEREPEAAPEPERQWRTAVHCPSCDTRVDFTFTIAADPNAPTGVFRTGPTWDRCPECGTDVAVPDCADAGHVLGEVTTATQSAVTCFVCDGTRRAPVPVSAGARS